MVFNHVSKLYRTLRTFDPKIVAQAHRAYELHYPLKLTITGSYPDRTITGVRSLEPIDEDRIPGL